MVVGLDVFRLAFAGFENQYALIGGAATEAHLEAAGLEFRATKDLDIVLCLEALTPEFVAALWAFIEAGGYEIREQSDGPRQFYRFNRPTDPRYPAILELFSRRPDVISLPAGARYSPIPTDGSVESLSAMLLDDNYYALIQGGMTRVEDVSVLDVQTLIVFKAYAYNNLARDKAAGGNVSSRNVTKHRGDVFKLLQLVPAVLTMELPEAVRADVQAFVTAVRQDEGFDPKALNLRSDKPTLLGRLAEIYGVSADG